MQHIARTYDTEMQTLNPQDRLLSPRQLAERWGLSRTGAVRIAEWAGLKAIPLGGVARGICRYRLCEVVAHEQQCVSAADCGSEIGLP